MNWQINEAVCIPQTNCFVVSAYNDFKKHKEP